MQGIHLTPMVISKIKEGNLIQDRTKNAQFIIISLRNNMFELADRLIGIYKTFDCTKSVAIDPGSIRNIIKPRMYIFIVILNWREFFVENSDIGILKLQCNIKLNYGRNLSLYFSLL